MLERILERIKLQLLRQEDIRREVVVGVGLSKTGTTSLSDALNVLGYRSFHTPPIIKMREDHQIDYFWPWWLSKYNAYCDLPVPAYYKLFDKKYPNAKFILTVRDSEDWLKSCKKHYTKEFADYMRNKSTNHNLIMSFHKFFYGAEVFDEDLYLQKYNSHIEEIMNYFEGRDNFLLLDIFNGEPYKELSSFLGKNAPTTEFPHSNKAKGA
jgi:Sulfotransferase domain